MELGPENRKGKGATEGNATVKELSPNRGARDRRFHSVTKAFVNARKSFLPADRGPTSSKKGRPLAPNTLKKGKSQKGGVEGEISEANEKK